MANRLGVVLLACWLTPLAGGVKADNVFATTSEGVACLVSESKTGQSIGSAFFIAPNVLATARHQVAGSDKTKVLLANGRSIPGRVIAMDPDHDLALVAIHVAGPAVLKLGLEAPRLGDPVFTIGCPMGLSHTLTRGVVSRKNTVIDGKSLIQADLSINLGNSGGPLVNQRGEVIGIVHGHIKKVNGINFAIPSRQLLDLMRKHHLPGPGQSPSAADAVLAPTPTAESLQQRIIQAPWVAEHYYNMGWLRLQERDLDAASQLFEQALLRKSPYPEALTNHGIVLHLMGKHAEARDVLLRAVSQAPAYGLAYFNLGVVYAAGLRDNRSAQASFKRFLELAPSSPQADAARRWLDRQNS